MIFFKLLNLSLKQKLPLRNQLEILLQIYLIEKPIAIHDSIVLNPTPLPGEHHLYNFLEVILKYILQFIKANPEILIKLYLNYDAQLFSLPIVQNFFNTLSKLVIQLLF